LSGLSWLAPRRGCLQRRLAQLISELHDIFVQTIEPIRPGRKYPRNHKDIWYWHWRSKEIGACFKGRAALEMARDIVSQLACFWKRYPRTGGKTNIF